MLGVKINLFSGLINKILVFNTNFTHMNHEPSLASTIGMSLLWYANEVLSHHFVLGVLSLRT